MVNLAKQIEDMFSHISDDALYHSYFNTRNDNGSSLRDGTDKGIFNQDLNFGPEIDDVVNAVNATRAAPQDQNAQMVLEGAVGALNRKVAIAFEMLDRANREGKGKDMTGFNPKHPLRLQDEPVGDSFRSRISTLLKPSVYGDVDKMLRLYSDILDYGQSLINESASKEAPAEEAPASTEEAPAPAPAANDSEVPAQTTQDDSAGEADSTEDDDVGLDDVEEKYLNGKTDMFGEEKVDNSFKPEPFDESQIPAHIPDVKPKTTQRHLEDFGSA
jgi:hypothetical protein